VNNSKKNTAAQILDSLTKDVLQGNYKPRERFHIRTLKERYNVGTRP